VRAEQADRPGKRPSRRADGWPRSRNIKGVKQMHVCPSCVGMWGWRPCPLPRGRRTLAVRVRVAGASPCSAPAAGQPAPDLRRSRGNLAAEAEAQGGGLQMMFVQGSGSRRLNRSADCLHSAVTGGPGAHLAARASCRRAARRWGVRWVAKTCVPGRRPPRLRLRRAKS
jgi:hypothetical protein